MHLRLVLPSEFVITKGTWMSAAMKYAANLDEIQRIVTRAVRRAGFWNALRDFSP
jgi:hypothetical protein